MQFSVYILRCRDGSYYTGHTDKPLELRLAEHELGRGSDWTRRRRPLQLVWSDATSSRYEALAFERRVKNWSRAKKEALIAGDWERVGYFARPPRERPSTSLGTNESLEVHETSPDERNSPFVPSEVEGRPAGDSPAP
jgi:putative endonuclease